MRLLDKMGAIHIQMPYLVGNISELNFKLWVVWCNKN